MSNLPPGISLYHQVSVDKTTHSDTFRQHTHAKISNGSSSTKVCNYVLVNFFVPRANLIPSFTDRATTSVLLPRWIRQDQSPVISWTWRTPFSGEWLFRGLYYTWMQWPHPASGFWDIFLRKIKLVYAVCSCRYTGTTPNPPPGSHYTSPSENMWNTGSAYNMSQGMAVSGEHTQDHESLTNTSFMCFQAAPSLSEYQKSLDQSRALDTR